MKLKARGRRDIWRGSLGERSRRRRDVGLGVMAGGKTVGGLWRVEQEYI